MNFTKEVTRGILYNFMSKYTNVFIQMILMIVLSRLLSPEIFGEITIVMTFLVFFYYFGNMGLGAGIVQRKDLTQEEINQSFNFTIILGIALFLIYMLFVSFIKGIYNTNIFEKTKYLIGVIVFFNSINTVPEAILRRNKNFKKISINEIISNIFSAIVALSLAYFKFGLYAIIFQNVSRVVLISVLNLKTSTILINFKFTKNFNFLKKIYRYSFFEFMTNIFNYFSRSADNILIPKYLGLVSLGYYDRAYRLILFPIKNFSQLITPILHPILSEFQNDKEKLYETFVRVSKIIMMLAAPISIFLYFNSEIIIRIVYGDKWISSSLYFKILAISLLPQMLIGVFQAYYLSSGNTRLLFMNNFFTNIILVLGIIVGIYFKNLKLVVINISVSYFVKILIDTIILVKVIFNKKITEYLYQIKNVGVIIIFLIASQYLIIVKELSIWLIFFKKGIIFFFFYIIIMFLTKEIYNIKFDSLGHKVKKK